MSVPSITAARLSGARHRAALPLLVLGPSLGTTAAALWTTCAQGLTDAFDVLAWDLPGHGHNHAVPDEPLTVADLARGVLRVVDDVQEHRGDLGAAFCYAGDSVGGAVGLQLLLDHPDRIISAAVIGSGARLGEAASWSGPSGQVSVSGTFDVRGRLGEIAQPVLAICGREDTVATVETMRVVAEGVRDGRLEVLDGVAHLAPAEAPASVATLLRRHFLGEDPPVAPASGSGLTHDFQRLLTEGAWGGIWTGPGLDRRSRSMIALAALIAGGHQEELAPHLRAARTNGLSDNEIGEVIVHGAIYSGVPAARAALRIAQEVLAEQHPEGDS